MNDGDAFTAGGKLHEVTKPLLDIIEEHCGELEAPAPKLLPWGDPRPHGPGQAAYDQHQHKVQATRAVLGGQGAALIYGLEAPAPTRAVGDSLADDDVPERINNEGPRERVRRTYLEATAIGTDDPLSTAASLLGFGSWPHVEILAAEGHSEAMELMRLDKADKADKADEPNFIELARLLVSAAAELHAEAVSRSNLGVQERAEDLDAIVVELTEMAERLYLAEGSR